MKFQKTKKLYYGKYPYKIELRVPGSYMIRDRNAEEIKNQTPSKNYYRFKKFSEQNHKNLVKFIDTAGDLLTNKKIKSRCESDTISFYSEEYSIHEAIHKKLSEWVIVVTEPENNASLKKLTEKKHIVLCRSIPYGKFQYRVHLNPYMPREDRVKFHKWLDNYKKYIGISTNCKEWLEGNYSWMNSPVINIQDNKHLAFIQLYLGKNLKKTEHYIVRSTLINSVTEDEICQQ